MDQLQTSWVKNKGLGMVIVSQFFGVGMNVITRMLEQDSMYGPKMQPFQVNAGDWGWCENADARR